MKITPYPIDTAPCILAIVLCRFPFLENPDTPPVRRSPCLVWRVRLHKPMNTVWLSVYFGTTRLKLNQRAGCDLIIQNAGHLREMGLHKATRFDLDKTADLPWCPQWFPYPNGRSTPVIGKLDETHTEILKRLLKMRAGN